MAKYCKVENDSAGIMMDDNSLGQVDFFYDILKERVAKVLKEKGIDPVEDRGATFVRSLYYIFNFIAFVIAGYWHIKVRTLLCPFLLFFTSFIIVST